MYPNCTRFDSGRLINKSLCLCYRGENQSTFRMKSKIVTAAIGDKSFLKDVTIRINHDSKVWKINWEKVGII